MLSAARLILLLYCSWVLTSPSAPKSTCDAAPFRIAQYFFLNNLPHFLNNKAAFEFDISCSSVKGSQLGAFSIGHNVQLPRIQT